MTRRSRAPLTGLVLVGALIVSTASAAPARAAEEATAAPPADRPQLRVGPLAPDFVLDGRMSEPAWAAADDSIANFTMVEPEEGGVPTAPTIVKVLADRRAIVLGIRCRDPEPTKLVAFSKARDAPLDEEDHVIVVFDPFLDGRSGYVFAVNPAGARLDGLVAARGEEVNSDWDAAWQARTSQDETGWCAEIRIPITSIAFKRNTEAWGLNLQRRVQRLQEISRWSGANLDYEVYQTSQAGRLTGLPDFDLGLGLSVRPAAVGRLKQLEPRIPTTSEKDLSLDVTQRLAPYLLSSFTVNTDFSETEVDVRRINLSRFPISFPEKRTFFQHGADIFEFGLGLDEETLVPFYSRRIGLVGSEEDELAAVPIDRGAKINGRVGTTNLGALVVNTRRASLQLNEFGPPTRVPNTTMGVVRVKQDILAESAIGMLATFGDQLGRRESWSGGVDLTLQTSSFQDDKNVLAGLWGLRSDREALTGDKYAYGARVDYPNDLVDATVAVTRVGDAFDPSFGFVPRRNVQIFAANAEIGPRPGWPLVRQTFHEVGYTQFKNRLTGRWESYQVTVRPLACQFESGDWIEVSIEPEGDRLSDQFEIVPDTDIGPGSYEWTRNVFIIRSAARRRLSGEFTLETGGFYTGTLKTSALRLTLKPSSMLTLEATGERNWVKVWSPEDYPTSIRPIERSLRQDVLGGRIELNVSPELQVSSLTQYDSESRELGSNTRLRWTFHPDGDLFLVYNHNEVRRFDNRWQFQSYQVPTKLQFAWRF